MAELTLDIRGNIEQLIKDIQNGLKQPVKVNLEGAGGKTTGGAGGTLVTTALLNQAVGFLGKIVSFMSDIVPPIKGLMGMFKIALLLFFKPFGDALLTLFIPVFRTILPLLRMWSQLTGGPIPVEKKDAGQLGGSILGGAAGGAVAGGIAGSIVPIIGTLTGALLGAVLGMAQPLFEIARRVGNIVGDGIIFTWRAVIKPALDAIGIGIDAVWNDFIQPAWTNIQEGLDSAWILLSGVWDSITEGLEASWVLLETVWTTITDSLQTVWDAIEPIWIGIKDILNTAWEGLKPVLDGIFSVFDWFWQRITGVLSLIADAWSGFLDALRNIPFVGDLMPKQVGGFISETRPYLLHRGEEVIPAGKSGRSGQVALTVRNDFSGMNVASNVDIDMMSKRITDNIKSELRSMGVVV